MSRKSVSGVDALKLKIRAMEKETDPKIVAQALRASMKPMLNAARSNAPQGKDSHRTDKGRLVAPGFLKRNIKIKKLRRSDKTAVAYGLWSQGEAWYGQVVEYGGNGIRSNPWLGKAYAAHKDGMVRSFKEEVSKRIIAKAKRIRSRS